MAPKCPNLVYLNVSAIKLTDASTKAIVTHCHQLIGLDISENNLTQASIDQLLQHKNDLKNLRQVSVGHSVAESDKEKLYKEMPQLDSLRTYYGMFIITAGLRESDHYWFDFQGHNDL